MAEEQSEPNGPVLWAGGTMVPRHVDGGIYTFRGDRRVTARPAGEAAAAKSVDDLPVRVESFALPAMNPGTASDAANNEFDEAFTPSQEGERCSVLHVFGLTPYYMIAEGDPVPASEADLRSANWTTRRAIERALVSETAFEPRVLETKPTIGIIDTGYLNHGNEVETAIDVDDSGEFSDPGTTSETSAAGLPSRARGHGRFVASVLARSSLAARLIFEKAQNRQDGVVDEAEVAQQLLDSAARGVDIINLSLGCYGRNDEPPLILEAAIRNVLARKPDLVIVMAAGNDGTTREFWPGAFAAELARDFPDQLVTVGALGTSSTPERALFSNHGRGVDWFAPGTGIVGCYLGASDEPEQRENVNGPGTTVFYGQARWEGTSFAAPHVAGLIAREMRRSDKSALAAWKCLRGMPLEKRAQLRLFRADEVAAPSERQRLLRRLQELGEAGE